MDKNLEEAIKAIGADAFLIIDLEGNLIQSNKIEHASNIALMTEAAFSMCKDLSQDLNNGDLDQLILQTTKGITITAKVNGYIVSILSKDFSKLGILLKKMNSINK